MVRGVPHFILLLILTDIATAFIFNATAIDQLNNDLEQKLKVVQTRRQSKKKSASTSSDGKRNSASGSDASDDETLDQDISDSSTDTDEKRKDKKDRRPKSSAERRGWRKWHRKCPNCPEDMHKKWRDPSIKWICGAYQRARRSFKSLCMMHYRNCQDGTMFTKIADHRCPNASGQVRPHGDHFFYDYRVVLTDDDTQSSVSAQESDKSDASSSSFATSDFENLPPLPVK